MDNNKNFKILNKYGYITYKFDKGFMFKYYVKDNHYFGFYKNNYYIIDLNIKNNELNIDYGILNKNKKNEYLNESYINKTKIVYPNKNDILLWNTDFLRKM